MTRNLRLDGATAKGVPMSVGEALPPSKTAVFPGRRPAEETAGLRQLPEIQTMKTAYGRVQANALLDSLSPLVFVEDRTLLLMRILK